MKDFNPSLLKNLYTPAPNSHKGQNGKLLIIGGSQLFHAASLWALEISSKFVDMVFYCSVPENNAIVQKAKDEFRNGIVVKRSDVENYIEEADCILIGPGLPRSNGEQVGDDDTKELSEKLLKKFPHKKWVIDGGSLQTIDPKILLELKEMPILTPHARELEKLFSSDLRFMIHESREVQLMNLLQKYKSIVLLKGQEDVVCSPEKCFTITGGNAGMTKGGTGDVLAGLVASLYCKNDPILAATCASYINKKAGEDLFEKVGYNFNSSDLVDQIPKTLKKLLDEN